MSVTVPRTQTNPILFTESPTSHCCPSGYWAYSNIGTNAYTAKCSEVNQTLCTIPVSGEDSITGTGVFSNSNFGSTGINCIRYPGADTSVTVNCTYSLDSFNTIENTYAYLQSETVDGVIDYSNGYTNQILSQFCGQVSTDCPVDPTTSVAMPMCSNFVSTKKLPSDKTITSGSLCQNWVENAINDDITAALSSAGSAMGVYCANKNNANNGDCGCINASLNPIFMSLGNGLTQEQKGCWWVPCIGSEASGSGISDTYLIPPNITTPTCPSTICQQITENFQSGNNDNITIGVAQASVSGCSVAGGTSNGDNGEIARFLKMYQTIIIVALVAIAALIIGAIIMDANKKKKR